METRTQQLNLREKKVPMEAASWGNPSAQPKKKKKKSMSKGGSPGMREAGDEQRKERVRATQNQ